MRGVEKWGSCLGTGEKGGQELGPRYMALAITGGPFQITLSQARTNLSQARTNLSLALQVHIHFFPFFPLQCTCCQEEKEKNKLTPAQPYCLPLINGYAYAVTRVRCECLLESHIYIENYK